MTEESPESNEDEETTRDSDEKEPEIGDEPTNGDNLTEKPKNDEESTEEPEPELDFDPSELKELAKTLGVEVESEENDLVFSKGITSVKSPDDDSHSLLFTKAPAKTPLKASQPSKKVTPPQTEIKPVNLLNKVKTIKQNQPDNIKTVTMTKQEVMENELERIRENTLQDEMKKRQKEQENQANPKLSIRQLLAKRPEKTIMVQLKGKVIEIKPNVDAVFTFICRGYDDSLKEPCYRFKKSLTFRQAINFKRFIEEFGCICRDRTNHNIILDPLLEQIERDIPIKLKEYDKNFLKIYFDEYGVDSVTGIVKNVVDKNQGQGKPQDDEDQPTKLPKRLKLKEYSDEEIEAKAKELHQDDTEIQE